MKVKNRREFEKVLFPISKANLKTFNSSWALITVLILQLYLSYFLTKWWLLFQRGNTCKTFPNPYITNKSVGGTEDSGSHGIFEMNKKTTDNQNLAFPNFKYVQT